MLDSVVGVFLTQNVSDALSSKAWMTLAATFPLTAINGREQVPGSPNAMRVSIQEWTQEYSIDNVLPLLGCKTWMLLQCTPEQ